MGAVGSILPDSIPEDIQALYALTERQKTTMRELDSTMLEAETGKMFKGHNKIIDELCARSKTQLKSLFEKYPNVGKQLDNLATSGNQYSKFIQQCGTPKAEFDLECIKSSDYDEELLVTIIGTSSTKELKALNELYTREFSFGVNDLCSTKNKSDSGFTKFVQRIFRFDRDESKEVNYDEAERLLDIIHKAGAARLLGVDEDTIIDILATTSRVQCLAINELYQKRHKMKLERALNMKFKGNFSKLLILWSTPLPSAIVSCAGFLMQKIIPDKNSIMRFFARFDKDILKLADNACREMHDKPLSQYISAAIAGNQLRALKVWIEEASPDKGFQKIIDIYIETKLEEGYTMEVIYQDAEMLAKLQFLLEKLASEFKLFLIGHKVKVDPGDLAIMNRSQASVQGLAKTVSDIKLKQQSMQMLGDLALSPDGDDSPQTGLPKTPKTPKSKSPKQNPQDFDIPERLDEDDAEAEAELATKEMMTHRKFSIVCSDNIQKNVHEQLMNHAYAFLISVFEDADEDAEGSLEAELFWETIRKLPLDTFGFVPRDIELIQKSSAWDIEGRVYYYEALLEFSDSVVSSIENKDVDDDADSGRDVIKIIDRLTKEKEDKKSNEDRLGGDITFGMDRAVYASKCSSRRTLSIRFGNIPVYFRQYVIDTLAAFDMDCAGYLKEGDVSKLLETLQIPSDVLNVQQFVDTYPKSLSHKGPTIMFDLKFCSEMIFKAINSWFGDGLEHFLCLIDKSNGAYFWFNTFDQSTQWVDNTTCGEISNEFKDFVLDESLTASAAAVTLGEASDNVPMSKDETKQSNSGDDTKADSKSTCLDEPEQDLNGDKESSPKSTKSSKLYFVEAEAKDSDETFAQEDKDSKPSLFHSYTSPNELMTGADVEEDNVASKKLEVSKSASAIDSHDSLEVEENSHQLQQEVEQ